MIPALEKLSKRKIGLQTLQGSFGKDHLKKLQGSPIFSKVFMMAKRLAPLDAQESYRLSSFAKANCLIQIDEDITSLKEGELVDVYLLPQ